MRLLGFFLMYLRVLYWDHFFLLFTFATSLLKIVTLVLLFMLMAIHRVSVHQKFTHPFLNLIKLISTQFHNNDLISNGEKSNLILSSKENLGIQVSSCSKRNRDSVKRLGIYINNNLNFDYHVNQVCKKASEKLDALA